METAERGDHSDMSTPLVRHTHSPFRALRDALDMAADASFTTSLLWSSCLPGPSDVPIASRSALAVVDLVASFVGALVRSLGLLPLLLLE